MVSLTRYAALEGVTKGIRVNTILPGLGPRLDEDGKEDGNQGRYDGDDNEQLDQGEGRPGPRRAARLRERGCDRRERARRVREAAVAS